MLRLFTRIQWVVLVSLLLSNTNHLFAAATTTVANGAKISNLIQPTGEESSETDEAQDDDESYSGCGGFRTYTQGGWGATPAGSNPGAYLQANFATAFPSGLIIGGTNKIVLTTATAVKNFLPQGSTPRQLNPGTLTNPTKSAYSNVLAGQLAAAMISVKMDKTFANFAPSTTALGDLVVSHGTFKNWTVNQLISAANSFIGGTASVYTAANFNLALTNINQSYDNGVMQSNYLVCPITFTSSITNVSCFNGNNGSISVSGVTGGTGAPYTYLWSNGATTASISGVVAGTYTLTITDHNGLTSTKSLTITEPTQLNATSGAGSILCNGGTTTVNVGANGGTAPYAGTGNFTVNAGTFNYTVTDANGCTATTSVTVTEPSLLTASSSAGTILCNGGSTTVNVSGNGGTTPYAGTGNFTEFAGTFNYTVTDANGCTASTSVTVTEPTALSVVSTSQTDDNSCNGGSCDGTATVNITGGTTPYSYNWTGGTSATNVLSSICFNTTPSVVVTDANGCIISSTFNVVNCPLLTCDPLRTQTQGAWGAAPKGNNPSSILNANFGTVFPNGVTVGSNGNFIRLTSAVAVVNFLPSGGTSSSISGLNINPTSNISNTLAGQLVAATINVAMDLQLANFSTPSHNLGMMYCDFHPFQGMTVNQVIAEANQAIGGINTPHSLSSLVNALDKINQNYDNGNQDNGDLVCQKPEGDDTKGGDDKDEDDDEEEGSRAANVNVINVGSINGLNLFPNPTENAVTIEFNANKVATTRIFVIGTNGQMIDAVPYTTVVGLNKHTMDIRNYAAHNNMLLIQVIVDGQVKQQMLSTPH